MAFIGDQRAIYRIQRDMQNELRDSLGRLAWRIGGALLAAAGTDGKIREDQKLNVRVEIGSLVDDYFTGTIPSRRGRHPFGVDGVTPLAEYPEIMNKYLARAIREAVEPHARYMQRVIPADVQQKLQVRRVAEQDGTQLPLPSPMQPSMTAKQRQQKLRIFDPNALAAYEPPHTWIDPKGYRLSDRIWKTDQETRMKIDRLVAEAIQKGFSAKDISAMVEQYLQPGRENVRTTKPYVAYRGAEGRIVQPSSLSFDGMRLGRTEIGRASSAACKAAAIANPYVSEMIWALSASHPKQDICDTLAANSPYPVDKAPVVAQDSHPMCICNVHPKVTSSPAEVTAQLREALDAAERENLQPILTPLQIESFTRELYGKAFGQLVERAGMAA